MFSVFFFNHTATTDIYTLSLHDALPIFPTTSLDEDARRWVFVPAGDHAGAGFDGDVHQGQTQARVAKSGVAGYAGDLLDRKSTRLNSSHTVISYAVFCLKKKKKELIN